MHVAVASDVAWGLGDHDRRRSVAVELPQGFNAMVDAHTAMAP